MRRILLGCLLLSSCLLQAQNTKVKFSSFLQVGLLDGQRGPAATIQTINGIQYKMWSVGAGVGIDYYHIRTVPVFLDVRRNILKKNATPFIYVDGGYSIPWLTDEAKMDGFVIEAKGGFYYDAGIGYTIPVFKKSNLFFTAGYSSKKVSTTESFPFIIEIWPPITPPSTNYDYTLRRISVKAGLRF